jgi:hypothetical protein
MLTLNIVITTIVVRYLTKVRLRKLLPNIKALVKIPTHPKLSVVYDKGTLDLFDGD